MPKSWIRHAFDRGILTSRYPAEPDREEELPLLGHAVAPSEGIPTAGIPCPTAAISAEGVDQGRCVRCARCFAHGFRPVGGAEASAGTRSSLRWPGGHRDLSREGSAPAPLPAFARSLHLFLIDVGSCQACNYETLQLANPYYDLHRLGLFFTNSPRQADVLIVVGVPTPAMAEPLRRTYEAIPDPKAVLAVGACAIDGGLFEDEGRPESRVAAIVPVDRYVAGCPPPPLAILEGLLEIGGRGRDRRGGRAR